ncbi:type 2 isopentenyl-diphosphate Delta-isomerase [Alkalicoccus halolimnae]|uniref:Isopentenyl-diphosphate delta-isomerase n=1 Tax=Alkalicoccus halolimnae TaxID=1667239 RepID=A0A5C7F0T8_9BACI|nr:type 2 isopentenyl-diphosphate Delta-isomerase [Alkalicoccus halolimnae]TXF83020.1 type 2 isopentenyl-diphosphate Delta-isomerase [Alkalicoccus halolimnae]
MSRESRKLDHIKNALASGARGENGLDDIHFVHNSLPETNVKDISLNTSLAGMDLSAPLLINAMTGGGGEQTEAINGSLAEVAGQLQIPIAVGSQMAALKDPTQQESYKVVRRNNRRGKVFANVGSEAGVSDALQCAEMIEADALQVHLNTVQELIMPEGDRDFTGTLSRIEAIVRELNIPVIVKEVGFGMSREASALIQQAGAKAVDTGGSGGTSFAVIENERRERPLEFFEDWGIPTAVSIAEAESSLDIDIIGSGGIRTAYDTAKAIALGACSCGTAGQVLNWLHTKGQRGTHESLEMMMKDITLIMTAVGAADIKSLQNAPVVILGETKDWLEQRGIDTRIYAADRRG